MKRIRIIRKVRNKRRTTIDTLLNFGICFGDIAPAIREKNPEKRMVSFFSTGTITQVGHFRTTTVFAITIQIIGGRIIGKAQIQRMELVDVDKTFGVPQEAFTNLSDLVRGIITRAINKKLADGIPMIMPQLGLPIDLQNIHLQIIEHALFISTDISIPSLAFYHLFNQRYTGCLYYNRKYN